MNLTHSVELPEPVKLNETHVGHAVRIRHTGYVSAVTVPGSSIYGELAAVRTSPGLSGVFYLIYMKDVPEPFQVRMDSLVEVTVFEEKSDVA